MHLSRYRSWKFNNLPHTHTHARTHTHTHRVERKCTFTKERYAFLVLLLLKKCTILCPRFCTFTVNVIISDHMLEFLFLGFV